MKQEDIQFLQQLQSSLLKQDSDPKMHDYQAEPRFWVVMDKEEIESKNGTPHVFDRKQSVVYTIDDYIKRVADEVYLADTWIINKLWGKVDKSDIDNVRYFAENKFKHDTEIIYIELIDKIAPNTFFLTKEAAEKHIEINHYHYREPRTYAMTAWRSPEFERFLKLFKQFDFSQIKI